jgi:hypothetical protein
MNDQKEVNLALRVAVVAARSHTGCAPETCGGTRYDECALGEALDALASYQRSAGYIKPPAVTAVDCILEHGVEHSDCPKCWHSSPRNPHANASDATAYIAPPAPDMWVLRTWADVRRGDVVRMPGQEATAAEVMELATLGWHVNDIPPANATPEQAAAFARDVQYRPNEHAGEWTARPVTLRPLAADDPAIRHRIPNVNPGAPVEIRCTQAELDAIELLGGWSQRVAVTALNPLRCVASLHIPTTGAACSACGAVGMQHQDDRPGGEGR